MVKLDRVANRRPLAFLEGLLAAIALTTFNDGSISFIAAFLLACAALASWLWDSVAKITSAVFGVIGVVASLPAAALYVSDQSCAADVPVWGRVLVLIGMAMAFAWSFVHAIFIGKALQDLGKVGLGWFSVVELLTFFSTTAVVSYKGWGLTVVIVGAIILGAVVGFSPDLALLVTGVGLALVTLAGGAIVGTPLEAGLECAQFSNATGAAFTYLVAFVPIMLIWVLFLRRLVSR